MDVIPQTEIKKLSPRVIWLFFITYLIRLGIIPVGFGFYLISLLPDGGGELSIAFYSSIFVSIIINIISWVLISFLWAWLTQGHFQYTLTENYFKKEFGIFRKRSVTIPYEIIQHADTDEKLLSRLLGLSELDIQVEGGTHRKSEGRIPGLLKKTAEDLRDELLERSRAAREKRR